MDYSAYPYIGPEEKGINKVPKHLFIRVYVGKLQYEWSLKSALDLYQPVGIICAMSKNTREKIVATTASLFEKQGYASTGLNEIVKESGTPRGSLYYYFPEGKNELAVEAVSYRMKKVEEVWRQSLNKNEDAIDSIYELIMVMAQIIENAGCDGGAPIATVALEASNRSESLRKACADGYQRPESVLATKLVKGGFSTEQATSLAATINASIEGAMIISRVRNDVTVLRGVAEHIKVLLETMKQK